MSRSEGFLKGQGIQRRSFLKLLSLHRHFVLSIPKILRRYFLYDRKLLSSLSRCAWEALKEFYQVLVDKDKSVPGAAVAIQTFGDFLGFNPHTHVLISDGCFYKEGTFTQGESSRCAG